MTTMVDCWRSVYWWKGKSRTGYRIQRCRNRKEELILTVYSSSFCLAFQRIETSIVFGRVSYEFIKKKMVFSTGCNDLHVHQTIVDRAPKGLDHVNYSCDGEQQHHHRRLEGKNNERKRKTQNNDARCRRNANTPPHRCFTQSPLMMRLTLFVRTPRVTSRCRLLFDRY